MFYLLNNFFQECGYNVYYFAIYHPKCWKMFEVVRGDRTTTNYGCHTSTLVWIKFIYLPNGNISDVDEHKYNDQSTNVVSHVIFYGKANITTNDFIKPLEWHALVLANTQIPIVTFPWTPSAQGRKWGGGNNSLSSPTLDLGSGIVPPNQPNEPLGWPKSNLGWGPFLPPWYPLVMRLSEVVALIKPPTRK